MVAGTDAAAVVLPHLANQLIAPRAQRAGRRRPGRGPGAWPTLMCQVLTTRAPGSGVPAAAVLAGRDPGQDLQSPEHSRPPTSGLAPVIRRSGSSIRGEHVPHGGNKRLKRAMFASTFASLRSAPASRACYQRKPGQAKAPWTRPSSPWPTAAS